MSAGGTCTRPRAKQASRGLADASKPVWAPVRDKGSGMGAGSARCRHAWTGTAPQFYYSVAPVLMLPVLIPLGIADLRWRHAAGDVVAHH